MPENCASIINMLIKQRHRLGMTQKELAEAACLTQSVIARFESKKAMPQLDTLLKVAAALGCELAILPAKSDVDILLFEEALEEHKKNPVTYSLEEVKRELGVY